MIADVADEKVVRRIELDAVRLVELGTNRGAAVTGESRFPLAGNRADAARFEVDLADAVVPSIGNVRFSRPGDGQVVHTVERRLGGRDALFLVSHGIVTAGATIERAAINALLLDRAARAQLLLGAAAIRAVSNEADSRAKRELLLSDGHQALRWGYLSRELARRRRK